MGKSILEGRIHETFSIIVCELTRMSQHLHLLDGGGGLRPQRVKRAQRSL